ncbi:MAG: OmpP1/FadL family transporter [Gammaproteobacteria bacterium]
MKRQGTWGPQIAAVLLLAVWAVPAMADGPALTRLYGAAENAMTAANTPAGMTRLDESQLATSLVVAQSFSRFKVDENRTTVDGGNPRNPDPLFIPSLGYVKPLSEDWRLGLSLFAPAGFGASQGPNWAGRYYSDNFHLVFVAMNTVLAYKVAPWLSLGGGVSINYSDSESTTQVNNAGSPDDAKLTSEADGVGAGLVFSALIEFTPRTRLGLNYITEVETDNDVKLRLKRSNLPQDEIDLINAAGDDIDVKLRSPARFEAGLFHEWESGWTASLDAIWIEMSRFGLSEIKVLGSQVETPGSVFDDFWVVTAGLSRPFSDRLEGRIGFAVMESPVNNRKRTLSFGIDNAYGGGVGLHYQRLNGNAVSTNLGLFNGGSGPVDTGDDPFAGRVAGRKKNHYLLSWGITYEFN